MKKLYVSNYIGFDESATKATLCAAYHTYEFVVVGGVLTLYDTLALNV